MKDLGESGAELGDVQFEMSHGWVLKAGSGFWLCKFKPEQKGRVCRYKTKVGQELALEAEPRKGPLFNSLQEFFLKKFF